jgi:hypothetical protein
MGEVLDVSSALYARDRRAVREFLRDRLLAAQKAERACLVRHHGGRKRSVSQQRGDDGRARYWRHCQQCIRWMLRTL